MDIRYSVQAKGSSTWQNRHKGRWGWLSVSLLWGCYPVHGMVTWVVGPRRLSPSEGCPRKSSPRAAVPPAPVLPSVWWAGKTGVRGRETGRINTVIIILNVLSHIACMAKANQAQKHGLRREGTAGLPLRTGAQDASQPSRLVLGTGVFWGVHSASDLQLHPLRLPLALISEHLGRSSDSLTEKMINGIMLTRGQRTHMPWESR